MARFGASWVAACATGELVGIGFAGLVGVAVTPLAMGAPSLGGRLVLFGAALAIGVVEGGALGLLQGRVLRSRLPRLRPGEWALPTALFGALGWILGMAGPILGQHETTPETAPAAEPPLVLVLGLAAAIGAVAGVLLGGIQALTLRRHGARSGTWVLANAVGWALAMPAIFAGFTAPPDGSSGLVRALAAIAGGLGGGALLGLGTLPFARKVVPWVDESAGAATLTGKVAVVTGATSGIGREVAVGLARLGAETILVGRSDAKLAATAAAVRAQTGAHVHAVRCDLAENASIDAAAARILELAPRVDLLVHDAASTHATRTLTADGREATLAVDALGPARLTAALDGALGAGARVLVLTGVYQRRGADSLDAEDLAVARPAYTMASANARAQRARLLFVSALAARRPDLFVAAVHPGAVRTAAIASAPAWARALAATLARPAFVRAELGALPVLRLATRADAMPSGRFWDRFTVTDDRPTAGEAATAQVVFA